ncbi:MAG: ThuA domain-containing protein [Gammaproteobacteria bacterium]
MKLITALLISTLLAPAASAKTIRVLAWSERTEPANVYPEGINGVIATMLKDNKNVRVTVANLSDPELGLSESVLEQTDVLVWFGHRKHKEVSDEVVDRVVRHVMERGMGYLPLHSAHYARPFQRLMVKRAEATGYKLASNPVGGWSGVSHPKVPQTIKVLAPKHPVAKGIKDFVIPQDEMYVNPFNVPPPDVKVLEGVWEGGEQQGSDGMIWNMGKGRVFYFRPGHETYPVFQQPEVQQVLKNAVKWLAQ